MMQQYQRYSGFTLLELLVSLVIASMATAMAFQLLYQYRLSNEKMFEQTVRGDQKFLSISWIHKALECSIAENRRKPYNFKGNGNEIVAYTMCPVVAMGGKPTAIKLTYDANAQMVRYQELSREFMDYMEIEPELIGIPADFDGLSQDIQLNFLPGEGFFAFMDDNDFWHRTWPVANRRTTNIIHQKQLPEAIGFFAGKPAKMLFFVAPDARKIPPIDINDVFG